MGRILPFWAYERHVRIDRTASNYLPDWAKPKEQLGWRSSAASPRQNPFPNKRLGSCSADSASDKRFYSEQSHVLSFARSTRSVVASFTPRILPSLKSIFCIGGGPAFHQCNPAHWPLTPGESAGYLTKIRRPPPFCAP